MKIDFTRKFTNFNGEVLKDIQNDKELTLGYICVEALLSLDKSTSLDGVEKLKRYDLALSIYKGEKETLKSEEISLLKDLIGKVYTTMIVGQAFKMLDSD